MDNNLAPLAVPSFSSEAWTSVGNTAGIELVGHETALAGTIHVKKEVDVEH